MTFISATILLNNSPGSIHSRHYLFERIWTTIHNVFQCIFMCQFNSLVLSMKIISIQLRKITQPCAKSDLDRVYDMLSIHFVKKSFCIIFLNVIQKCLVVTSRNPYGENCHFFFCINFDKVINLVVKVNLLDKKVLCIGWVTYQATFHFLNEINWTYTFWDMIKFIRRGLTFLEGFSSQCIMWELLRSKS